jgi:hypothetical protein
MGIKKDAYLPGLRVPSELAEQGRTACEKLGIKGPEFRRALLLDLIRIAESREQPAMPPRILTAREAQILENLQGSGRQGEVVMGRPG